MGRYFDLNAFNWLLKWLLVLHSKLRSLATNLVPLDYVSCQWLVHVNVTFSLFWRYFLHGVCREGSRCMFSHDPTTSKPSTICKFYQKGVCAYGDRCRWISVTLFVCHDILHFSLKCLNDATSKCRNYVISFFFSKSHVDWPLVHCLLFETL